MIPELGHVGLILALQLALWQAVFGLSGVRGRVAHVAAARGAAAGQCLFVALAFGALVWAFASNDFSVLNVAEHSSRHLPLEYRITATWGSHEGSILLWVLILSGWSAVLAGCFESRSDGLAAGALGILGMVSASLLAFVLLTSNPFKRLDPPPPDGLDLNPLLQDPGMVAHPPLLYMGYVGLSVAFAFAVSALLSGRLDRQWAKRATPWTLVAWTFLTLGIAVGSGWAYYELGWGGWWFWDPTENASLMPWLVATALLHCLRVSAQRGVLQALTVALAIGAFALSLVGTFLVRSGVLSSVHAFAQDPARGFFLLLMLALLIGAALAILALRAPKADVAGGFSWLSRETLVLSGCVLMLVATASVLLGTLYPLILDALGQGKVSVGPPYFDAVFVPLMVPVLLLLGAAPLVDWRHADAGRLACLGWFAALAVALGFLLPTAFAAFRWQAALGIGLGAWILLATGASFRSRPLSLRAIGMVLAHGGIAVGIVGIGLVTAFEHEQSRVMKNGERLAFAGYEIEFKGVSEMPGPNYSAVLGSVSISRNGVPLADLLPEKRIYHASKMPMSESAIHSALSGDLYVVLGDALRLDTWTLRLFFKPFIGWIWGGAFLMALGGLLAAIGSREPNVRAA